MARSHGAEGESEERQFYTRKVHVPTCTQVYAAIYGRKPDYTTGLSASIRSKISHRQIKDVFETYVALLRDFLG